MRARRFDELDLRHPIEEVADFGSSLERSVINNAIVVIEHLLKLEHGSATAGARPYVSSVGV